MIPIAMERCLCDLGTEISGCPETFISRARYRRGFGEFFSTR